MKVRMLARISGTRDGHEWPPLHGVADVTADEAAHLIESGLAEVASEVETADAPTAGVETATRKQVRKRRG